MAEDTYMTNTEADAGWQDVKLMAYDKETNSYIQKTPEQLLSHKNIFFHRNRNKTSNGERNSLRKMQKFAGNPVDENHTLEKRANTVATGAVIGLAVGAVTGPLGVWAGGLVSTLGSAAAQTITKGFSATGKGTTVHTDGKTVSHTFKYTVDGEEFSRTIDHYIPGESINVPGETVTGEVKVDVPERPVNTEGRPTWSNYRDAAILSGAVGAATGAGTALAGAHNITDLGTRNDGTIKNQKRVVKTTPGNVKLNLQTKQTITVMSGDREVSRDNPDITWTAQFSEKRRRHADGKLHNMVDSKMAAVSTAYDIKNVNDQKLIYDFIMQHNNLANFKGRTQYTNNLQYNFPKYLTKDMIPGLSKDYEIPTNMINGSSISLSNLEQVDIILTNGAYNGRNGQSTPTSTKRTSHIKGTAHNI